MYIINYYIVKYFFYAGVIVDYLIDYFRQDTHKQEVEDSWVGKSMHEFTSH